MSRIDSPEQVPTIAASVNASTPLWKSRLAIIVAGLLWSMSGLFGKLGVFNEWPEEKRGLLLSFWRAGFAALILLPFVRRPRWRWEMLPMGFCFAVMVVSFLSSMTWGTSANAIWLQYTAPCWVLLAARFVFREPWEPGAWGLILPALVGVTLILFFEFRSLQGEWAMLAVISGLVSAITYALVVLFLRRMRTENAFWLVAVNQSLTALFLLPFVVSWGIWPTLPQLLSLALFGVLQMALPYLLFSWGLKQVPSHEATILTLVEPFLVPVWAYFMIGEVPALWTIAGAAVIVFGLTLRYVLAVRRANRVATLPHA
jgi:DME family drug/metabolite transporter